MLKLICRLSALLLCLCLIACSKKNDPQKNLQWRTQCEQMILKGADGLLSHHDCFNRCTSHYTSYCENQCSQALQEAKVTHEEAKAQCKKDIRIYMGKKCRHVCEMTTSELQTYRQDFAKGVSQDKSYDSDCPCKGQKDVKDKDPKATPSDPDGDTQPLADESDESPDDTNDDGPSSGTASAQPDDTSLAPAPGEITLPSPFIETQKLYAGDAVDLPWLALPGSLHPLGQGPQAGFRSPFSFGTGSQGPVAPNSDLPWVKPAFSAAPAGRPPYAHPTSPQGTHGFAPGMPVPVNGQHHAISQKHLDDLTAARRAETEQEAAKAFEPDETFHRGNQKTSSSQTPQHDGFLKGFAPAKTFSISQGELDKLQQGDLSGLETLKQSLNQTKKNITLDVKQLKEAAHRKDFQSANEVMHNLKTDVSQGVEQVKGKQPTPPPYDSPSTPGQYQQQQPYRSQYQQGQYRQQQPYRSPYQQGQYRQPYDSRYNQGSSQPQRYQPY